MRYFDAGQFTDIDCADGASDEGCMNILIVLIFIGFVLVLGGVVLFVYSAKNRDFDSIDRISLMPLEEDNGK